jgi:hypothetical protein
MWSSCKNLGESNNYHKSGMHFTANWRFQEQTLSPFFAETTLSQQHVQEQQYIKGGQ